MTNIASAKNYLQTPATLFRGPVSNAFFNAIGGSLNYALDLLGRPYFITSSSGAYSTTSTSLVSVTNLSQVITTVGRPVLLTLAPDNVSIAYLGTAGAAGGQCSFFRGSTAISNVFFSLANPGAVTFIDHPTSGTYTYTFRVATNNGAFAFSVNDCKMVVVEL